MKFAEPIIIESSLSHNNGRTGMGKFYVAKIIGLNPKYKYDRMFLNRDYNATHNSKTSWYSYWCEIKEEGFYEIAESNWPIPLILGH
jgi:hypothetical protein